MLRIAFASAAVKAHDAPGAAKQGDKPPSRSYDSPGEAEKLACGGDHARINHHGIVESDMRSTPVIRAVAPLPAGGASEITAAKAKALVSVNLNTGGCHEGGAFFGRPGKASS